MTRLEVIRSIAAVTVLCGAIFFSGLVFGASRCTADAKPTSAAPAPKPPFSAEYASASESVTKAVTEAGK